jgi:hypothetical protein
MQKFPATTAIAILSHLPTPHYLSFNVYAAKWAEVLTLPLPKACGINLPSLPFTTAPVFIWCIGVSGCVTGLSGLRH